MIDLDILFKYKILNLEKLLAYGFIQHDSLYIKEIPIINKRFNVQVTVCSDGKVSYKVIENALKEEYILVNLASANGSFVRKVRASCERTLNDIGSKCFDTELLKSEQTKRIVDAIFSRYGAEPEFLWKRSPDYAAFRRKDNLKWFAIIMTIERRKLGLMGYGNIEIMDMKAEPKAVLSLLETENYYPAYHMNKTHWFTVCLDGSISDEVLLKLLSDSYQCFAK